MLQEGQLPGCWGSWLPALRKAKASDRACLVQTGGDHTESVLTRNCLTFILSHLVGRQLREKAQLTAAKELVCIL